MCKMLRHPTCCGSGDGYKTSVPVQHSTHHSLNLTSVIQLGLIAKSIGTDRSVFPLPSDHLPSLFPSDSASAMQKPPLLPWRMAATELLFLQQNGKQPTMNQRTTAAARQGKARQGKATLVSPFRGGSVEAMHRQGSLLAPLAVIAGGAE